MKTHIEISSSDYDQLAVWPMTTPVYDSRPVNLRGPDVGLHVHGYKNGKKTLHGTFDLVVIDGKEFEDSRIKGRETYLH